MNQTSYEFYWNDRKDEQGRNISMCDGYQQGDPLRLVYAGELDWHLAYDLADDQDVLNALYEKFNIDHPKDYRGPSMSVGSVIWLSGAWYAVEAVGFKHLSVHPEVKA